MSNRAERRAAARAKGVILDPSGGARVEKVPDRKVVSLGYLYQTFGDVAGRWHQSVLKLLQAASASSLYGFREIPVETGPFLSRARNIVVKKFLDTTDDYLLFSDTDTVFEPNDVGLLFDADAAIAGALYYAAAPDQSSWATALVEDGDGAYAPLVLPELPDPPTAEQVSASRRELGYDEDGDLADYETQLGEWFARQQEDFKPQKVAGVGMGLTLIRRDVVEVMAANHDHPFEFQGEFGEDLIFCLRAAKLGFDTMVVPQARIGHIKRGVI